MLSLKQRLNRKADIKGLNDAIKSIENGDSSNLANKKMLLCLGLSDEWMLSNGFEIKEEYSNEQSMSICKISYLESSLKCYLLNNKKTLQEDAEIHYFLKEPYIKFTDIIPFNPHIMFIGWNVSGHCSSIVEFNNTLYLSCDYFIIVEKEEDFISDMKISCSEKYKLKPIPKTYLIIDYNTNYHKIGKSINPLKREKTLGSEKPTIKLVLVCEENIESKLHKIFSKKRIRGEWFDLNANDILLLIEKYNFKEPRNDE